MQPGFQPSSFNVATEDGRNFAILSPIIYTSKLDVVYRIPAGTTTDGASTPNVIWLTIPPFGSYWRAAVLHDAAYRNKLEIQDGENWKLANLSKEDSDNLLREAMAVCGTHQITADEIYEGVHFGGWKSFRDDRA